MAKTNEEKIAAQELLEERQKCLKVVEKKVKGGIVKSVITLENINETTGAPLTFVKKGDNVIEVPITMALGIIRALADTDTQERLNRMLKAQCDSYSYNLDLLKEGVKVASKKPKDPNIGRARG